MKVLTFGWEFPPARNGGLGVACFGLTRELARAGVEVIFVLPKLQKVVGTPRFVFADTTRTVRVREVPSGATPYSASGTQFATYDEFGTERKYLRSILQEVQAFAHKASSIALQEDHDIIHAHDWTSYLAGVAAKRASGKPLILHVHATSFDQAAAENVDPEIYNIEKESFAAADTVVTVSQYTKDMIVKHHAVPADKVVVVHNGCDTHEPVKYEPTLQELKKNGTKIVLYHGRITVQKGVDYFVRAAKRVLDAEPNTVFVISGSGDMETQIIEQVGSMGLSQQVRFAGATWDEERDRLYQAADLIVMPSVSEPFGLVPLEAMQHGTPAVISKQSGVSEVTTHVLKVDFWDIEDMANKIVAALRYPVLNNQLVNEGKRELQKISWSRAAVKIKDLYQRLLQLVSVT